MQGLDIDVDFQSIVDQLTNTLLFVINQLLGYIEIDSPDDILVRIWVAFMSGFDELFYIAFLLIITFAARHYLNTRRGIEQ